MSRKKRLGERRTYPWRAALTDVACSGDGADRAHLPLLYGELVCRDPMGAPYEYSCPRCDMTGPSCWWDEGVPVPPHEFIKSPVGHHVAENWQCRVCLRASDNRMFHPAPTTGPFDPARVPDLPLIEEIGGWGVALDESLGIMEAYVDHQAHVVVFNSETWKVVDSDDDASDLLSVWRDGASGMRFLAGVPAFDRALRKYRSGRGEDVVQAKDEITQLMEVVQSLATQAVSVGADDDVEQRQILAGRYFQARRRFQELQERMAELEAGLDTAAMAVMAYG
jgi:hypothetical protein